MRRILFLSATCALIAASAQAEPAGSAAASAPQTYMASSAVPPTDYLLFAGGEISGHNAKYGSVGLIGAFPGYHFGQGPVWRAVVDGLTYSYKKAGATIDADSFGGELSLGYIVSTNGGSSIAGYVGAIGRNTDFSPNDPANDASGGQWGVKLQLDGEQYFTPDFKFVGNASYVISNANSYWLRGRLLARPMGTFFVGPEFVWQADDEDASAWQTGLVINTILIDRATDLGFRLGWRKAEDFSGSVYGGIELSHSF